MIGKIHTSPKRTKMLLRVRRRLAAIIAKALIEANSTKSEAEQWPEEAIAKQVEEQVNTEMQDNVSLWPNSRLRRVAANL